METLRRARECIWEWGYVVHKYNLIFIFLESPTDIMRFWSQECRCHGHDLAITSLLTNQPVALKSECAREFFVPISRLKDILLILLLKTANSQLYYL